MRKNRRVERYIEPEPTRWDRFKEFCMYGTEAAGVFLIFLASLLFAYAFSG